MCDALGGNVFSQIHGNDDRVSVESRLAGTETIYRTLVDVE